MTKACGARRSRPWPQSEAPRAARISRYAGADQPAGLRVLALAALARLDVEAAAARFAEVLTLAAAQGCDLTLLLAAFLNRQGGADILAAALGQYRVAPDAAKLALRSVYALGHADAALVATLSRAAGLATEVKPPSPQELIALVAEVLSRGDPARGEVIFRRADLNCLNCHSINKAGGDVGPDLSSIGQSSPPDYIISSILTPDQSIKEQFHTLHPALERAAGRGRYRWEGSLPPGRNRCLERWADADSTRFGGWGQRLGRRPGSAGRLGILCQFDGPRSPLDHAADRQGQASVGRDQSRI